MTASNWNSSVANMSSGDRKDSTPSQPRILVADDNPVNLKLTVLLLKRIGYEADTVANGREALDAMAGRAYDVVLMDVQMPVMDGLEATRRIARLGDGARRPLVIGMTANAVEGFRQTCLEAGMIDYISKPVEPEALKAVLQRALEEQAATDASQDQANPLISDSHLDFLVQLAGPFVDDTTRTLTELSLRADQGEPAEVGRLAHRLKGSCQIFGAHQMASICEELEELGRSGSAAAAGELISRLEEQFQLVKSQLPTD